MTVQINQDEALKMLEELVNIDSGSYVKEGVDRVGSYLRGLYEALGFEAEELVNTEHGNNISLKHKDAKDPEIIAIAHMDTVFPEGTAAERPFSIQGDRAYGPGVIDMKASHVMLYHAVKALSEAGDESYKNIEILLTSDEEIGSVSSRSVIEAHSKAKKYALVLEPARADGSIVSARRGAGSYELEITGKAAHSGIEPDNGRSAIRELAHKVFEIEALSRPEEGLHVNVVQAGGGKAANMIAPNAHAVVDVRISKMSQGEWVDAQIRKIAEVVQTDGTKVELSGGVNRPPMEYTEGTKKMVDLITEEGSKLGLEIKHTHTGGGSDASFPAALGVDTLDGLGPVGGKQHSAEEYLETGSLVARTELFINFLKRL